MKGQNYKDQLEFEPRCGCEIQKATSEHTVRLRRSMLFDGCYSPGLHKPCTAKQPAHIQHKAGTRVVGEESGRLAGEDGDNEIRVLQMGPGASKHKLPAARPKESAILLVPFLQAGRRMLPPRHQVAICDGKVPLSAKQRPCPGNAFAQAMSVGPSQICEPTGSTKTKLMQVALHDKGVLHDNCVSLFTSSS